MQKLCHLQPSGKGFFAVRHEAALAKASVFDYLDQTTFYLDNPTMAETATPAWTDERVNTLTRMWKSGQSAQEIASELGITRNAVIGKAHRLGLSGRPSPIKKKEIGCTILQLNERTCRWPMGDPKDGAFRFCGKQVHAHFPYCMDHALVAYQQPAKKGEEGKAEAAAAKDAAAKEAADKAKQAVAG